MLKLGRVHIAPLGAFPFPLGLALTGTLDGQLLFQLSVLGILLHSLGCAANDVADAPTDRLNPLRAKAPLVQGDCTTIFAIGFVVVQALLVVALGLQWFSAAPSALVLLIALLVVDIYGNVFQKRFPGAHPFITDFLFGLFIASPLLLGSLLLKVPLEPWILWLAASFTLQGVLLNVLGGNLKDLWHDTQVGSNTAAVALGATSNGPRMAAHITTAYRSYSLTYLLLAFGALSVALLLLPLTALETPRLVVACLSFAAMAAALCGALVLLFRSSGTRLFNVGAYVLWPMLTSLFLAAAAGAWNIAVPVIFTVAYAAVVPGRQLILLMQRRAWVTSSAVAG